MKRRQKRTFLQLVHASVYPKGGWGRAIRYVRHRLSRLPDAPHKIARGIFAGVFVSFTPFFGLHFLLAFLMALILRGNVVAALLATLIGNPLTFPFIAVVSVELGNWMLGSDMAVHSSQILNAFGHASTELWENLIAMFTSDPTHWDRLRRFFYGLWLPYLVGGIAPGIVAGLACYYLSMPVLGAYQMLRQRRLRDRAEVLRERAAARLREAAAGGALSGDDADAGSH
jgi:uncharacterized protein (DUF2062 family)